jgi:hypothetical protein
MGYVWNANTWKPASRYTIAYTSANLESSSTREDWNGSDYLNTIRDFSTYNSFGQLVTAYGESFKSTIWGIGTGDPNERNSYQNYATRVAPLDALADLKLFPVPAKDYIHIQMQWTNAQPFSMGIYDMSGRLCQQWSEVAIKDYYRKVPTANLPAGVYMLRVAAEEGTLEKVFSVQ